MLRSEWVEPDGDEEGGWYVVRGSDRVSGPFDSDDEADWWISKCLEV